MIDVDAKNNWDQAVSKYISNSNTWDQTVSSYISNSNTNGNSNYITWTTATTAIPSDYYSTYQPYIVTNASLDDYKEILEKIKKEEENKKMSNSNFNFGPYATDYIRMSIYGMAIKNKAGKWVSYDAETKRLMDVDIFNFNIDSSKIFYKIPKAIDEVRPGDIILHNDKPVFIEEVRKDGKFDVINPYEGEAITILPPTSPFGFNYLLAIVSLMDALPEASSKNPFGKFLPFLLSGNDNSGMLAVLMMMNEGFEDIDPWMLMAMCGKGDINSLLLLQMMQKKDKKGKKSNKSYDFTHAVKFYDSDDTLDHFRAVTDMDEE